MGYGLLLLVASLIGAVMSGFNSLLGRPRVAVYNTNSESGVTTHEHGCLTRVVEDDHPLRHLLVTFGSDAATEVTLAGAADNPIGVVTDEGVAGDKLAVELLGRKGTQKLRGAGAFPAGVQLFAAADGRVSDNGTVLVGVSLTASEGADSFIEAKTVFPV